MAGKVVDQQTNAPLPYATVQVKGTSIGSVTDETGTFHLHDLCVDEFDLVISFVGYKTITHHHDLYHDDPIIYLSADDALLKSVVVEGQKAEMGLASATAVTIGPQELENSQGKKLGEILKNISGVSTLSTGQNIVKPVVHGLHSSRVLIINNGVRHEGQNWGAEHAPEIDPSLASSLTLIKGAASVKYGPGALGGVIIVNPPQPNLTRPLSGEADITLRSNGRSAGGSFLVQEGYSSLAWLVQAAGLFQGDLHAPDYMLTNTGAREASFSASGLYHKKYLDLKLHYSYFRQKLGILRGSVVGSLANLEYAMEQEPPAYTSAFSYQINNPHQETTHQLLKLDGTYSFVNSVLRFQYGLQHNNRQEFDVRRGSTNELPAINMNLTTHNLDAEWEHPSIYTLNGTVGLQAQYQDNNNVPGTNTIPFLPNYNNFSIGAYIIESKEIGNTLLEAGLRFDALYSSIRGRDNKNDIYRSSLEYTSLTGNIGLLHTLSSRASISSHLGLAWRPPNIAELYSFGKHGFIIEYGLWRNWTGGSEVATQADKPIASEKSYKWVTTYNYEYPGVSLELTGHLNYVHNFIYGQPAGITINARGPFPFFNYTQTNALLSGLDASLQLKHSTAWTSQLKATLLYATSTSSQSELVGIAPNRLSYALQYNKEKLGFLSRFSSGLETIYTFKQYQAPPVISAAEIREGREDDQQILVEAENGFDFIPAPEGYLLLNFYTAASWRRFNYRLGISNLLNTEYREYTNRLRYFADEIGRSVNFSVKYSF